MSEVESIKSEKLKGEKAKTQKPIKVMNRKKNLQKLPIGAGGGLAGLYSVQMEHSCV